MPVNIGVCQVQEANHNWKTIKLAKPIRQQGDDKSEPMLMHDATSAATLNITDLLCFGY